MLLMRAPRLASAAIHRVLQLSLAAGAAVCCVCSSAHAQAPAYRPQPLEFPPFNSEHRMGGALVSVDFILRKGQFREAGLGALVDFSLPSYGTITYLGAEADLRDVPLDTHLVFFMHLDEEGSSFSRAAAIRDQFSLDAAEGLTYRLEEVKPAEGKLLTTRHRATGKAEGPAQAVLTVNPSTRFWKGAKQVTLQDLKPGDELLYNATSSTSPHPDTCTDIWVGAETHKLATETQRGKFLEFLKARGLPAWVEKTEGNKVTLTIFSGEPQRFMETFKDEIVKGKDMRVCVANDELRTWNPPVDAERGRIEEVQPFPVTGFGSSGVRLTLTLGNMLEGFRKGRVVRLLGSGWKAQDQFYGESLMGYGFGRMMNLELVENPAREYPEQFPFRTDFSNRTLPWFKLQPGEAPPPFSEHLVIGVLTQVDAASRSGQFRMETSGAPVDFTLIPQGSVKYLNADAILDDIPPGTRCRFHLYQDASGHFTQAASISDEFTRLAQNAITYRVESLDLTHSRLHIAHQLPEVKDYNGDMQRPPDTGRSILRLSPTTRFWKGTAAAQASDLAVGDVIMLNLTGGIPESRIPSCTDIWIGPEAQSLATDTQKKKHAARPSAEKAKAAAAK